MASRPVRSVTLPLRGPRSPGFGLLDLRSGRDENTRPVWRARRSWNEQALDAGRNPLAARQRGEDGPPERLPRPRRAARRDREEGAGACGGEGRRGPPAARHAPGGGPGALAGEEALREGDGALPPPRDGGGRLLLRRAPRDPSRRERARRPRPDLPLRRAQREAGPREGPSRPGRDLPRGRLREEPGQLPEGDRARPVGERAERPRRTAGVPRGLLPRPERQERRGAREPQDRGRGVGPEPDPGPARGGPRLPAHRAPLRDDRREGLSVPVPVTVVLLAAGRGVRMRSARPKVLHEAAGRPLIDPVVAAARALLAGRPGSRLVVVAGAGREELIPHLARTAPEAVVVVQDPPRGTGDAV
ncbi:MAG: NTP transferase domain-containing protein, partial [Thermoanaerobaculia bacterium]|nr:NTP transferase domain-containing protein [Thermoanaerobaculia bacterium]